jgi:GT2 family glycosyltransferase
MTSAAPSSSSDDPVVIAAIPVRNELEWTQPLVESILASNDADQVWLFDNGSTDGTFEWATHLASTDARFTVSQRPSARLYGMWNEMVSRATFIENSMLAILNNDIRLARGALRRMSLGMHGHDLGFVDRQLDDTGVGEVRAMPAHWGQTTGHAFMLRSSFWVGEPYAIDPGLRIWWGDDDISRRAQARGARLCIVEGIGCFHAESKTTYPGNMHADVEHDREYFHRIWNDN